jgi:hypothetical protein
MRQDQAGDKPPPHPPTQAALKCNSASSMPLGGAGTLRAAGLTSDWSHRPRSGDALKPVLGSAAVSGPVSWSPPETDTASIDLLFIERERDVADQAIRLKGHLGAPHRLGHRLIEQPLAKPPLGWLVHLRPIAFPPPDRQTSGTGEPAVSHWFGDDCPEQRNEQPPRLRRHDLVPLREVAAPGRSSA